MRNGFDPPIDPYANAKTRRILAFFREIYGRRTLSGQYTNHDTDTETDLLFRETGRYPAVRGFDFIFDSPALSPRTGKDADLVLFREDPLTIAAKPAAVFAMGRRIV